MKEKKRTERVGKSALACKLRLVSPRLSRSARRSTSVGEDATLTRQANLHGPVLPATAGVRHFVHAFNTLHRAYALLLINKLQVAPFQEPTTATADDAPIRTAISFSSPSLLPPLSLSFIYVHIHAHTYVYMHEHIRMHVNGLSQRRIIEYKCYRYSAKARRDASEKFPIT